MEVSGLCKRYGEHEALRGIDIVVARGEVFGLLGPNGAGKTTTVEILEGYRARSAGEVSVLGCDPARRAHPGPRCTPARVASRRCSRSPASASRRTPARAASAAASCAAWTSR